MLYHYIMVLIPPLRGLTSFLVYRHQPFESPSVREKALLALKFGWASQNTCWEVCNDTTTKYAQCHRTSASIVVSYSIFRITLGHFYLFLFPTFNWICSSLHCFPQKQVISSVTSIQWTRWSTQSWISGSTHVQLSTHLFQNTFKYSQSQPF